VIKLELKKESTIRDVLIHAYNEHHLVELNLLSGKKFSGTIKSVGQYAIILEQEEQRTYYDAFIRIEHISAVEMKVRS